MIIAREKKKSNVAEYILYMWQVEDMIRACSFDIEEIEKNIISRMKMDKLLHEETRIWYTDLVDKMKKEEIEKSGHLAFVIDTLDQLETFHHKLLNELKNEKYINLYKLAGPNINALREKGKSPEKGDIYVSLTGLYGLLVLRLRKKVVSGETAMALQTISNLVAFLSAQYMKRQYPGK